MSSISCLFARQYEIRKMKLKVTQMRIWMQRLVEECTAYTFASTITICGWLREDLLRGYRIEWQNIQEFTG